jgi:peptidyl-prolyl cis-trans isomerase D
MRKHARSWLIKFLIAIIAIVFIFYFGYSFRSQTGLKVASVNDDVITGVEYDKAYRDMLEAYRMQYKDMWSESLLKALDLKRQTLERLIDQKLIAQEADRLGLRVTEKELQHTIMGYPAFQTGGQFDLRRYRGLLQSNRMNPEDFELTMSQHLLEAKVKQFLGTFAKVTEKELEEQYTFYNEQVNLSFVQFNAADFKKGINPDQAALEAYFKDNQEKYRTPAMLRVAYLIFDPAAFEKDVKIGDKEIEEYYEYNKISFKEPKKVKARHILFKVGEKATEEEEKKVRDRAKSVLEMAKQGKDFAELALNYSEDMTKARGGDLGYFGPGTMTKPFEDAAFALDVGQISDLVRSSFGYHIIKVEDKKEERTKPLEEVKEEIRKILVKGAAAEKAHEKGLSVIDQMPYDVDLTKYASEQKLDVKLSSYFPEGQAIPEMGGTPNLIRALPGMKKGDMTDLMDIGGKFYLFQLEDKKPSVIPKLKEVEGKVREGFIADKALEQAKKAAEEHLAALKGGKAWEEAASGRGLKTEESGFFSRREPVGKIGNVADLKEAAFSLTEKEPYPEKVFTNDKAAYVVKWTGRKGYDTEKFEKEKEQYRQALLSSKRERLFRTWLGELRANSKITILKPSLFGE